jgi:catalase
MRSRISKHSITYKTLAQIAEDRDKIEDPSIAWPHDRKTDSLG